MATDIVTEQWDQIRRKLGEPRVYYLDPAYGKWYTEDLKGIGFGARYGGHLRKGEWHLELGGPAHNYDSFIWVEYVDDPGQVDDGRVEHWGPEMNEVPPETSLPFMWHIRVAGMALTPQIFPMSERGIVIGFTWTEGVMVVGSRSNVWMRISKSVADRLSIQKLAQSIYASCKTWSTVTDRIEQRVVIATPEMGGTAVIKPMLEVAKVKWEEIEARQRDFHDEDVDEFVGCTICRLIAPSHCCVITPERPPYCGFLNYEAAKTFVTFEPSGFLFTFNKGECLDAEKGWYTGVDEVVYEKSGGRSKKVYLYSCLHYPTSN